MLVLSRKKNDSIVIQDNIVIEVIQIKGSQVRLGIRAPKSVKVLRGELERHSDSKVSQDCSMPQTESMQSSYDPPDEVEVSQTTLSVLAHAG